MLDPQRIITTTYRFRVTEPGYFEVTTYPKYPSLVVDSVYRFDVLPDWIQDAIRMLDAAGVGYPVDGLGRKVGDTYWVEAELEEITGVCERPVDTTCRQT